MYKWRFVNNQPTNVTSIYDINMYKWRLYVTSIYDVDMNKWLVVPQGTCSRWAVKYFAIVSHISIYSVDMYKWRFVRHIHVWLRCVQVTFCTSHPSMTSICTSDILYVIYISMTSICTGTLEHLLKQENMVLEFWTARKRKLDQCQQFVLLENSAQQVGLICSAIHVSI